MVPFHLFSHSFPGLLLRFRNGDHLGWQQSREQICFVQSCPSMFEAYHKSILALWTCKKLFINLASCKSLGITVGNNRLSFPKALCNTVGLDFSHDESVPVHDQHWTVCLSVERRNVTPLMEIEDSLATKLDFFAIGHFSCELWQRRWGCWPTTCFLLFQLHFQHGI